MDDVVDNYFEVEVADTFHWLQNDNSEETKAWKFRKPIRQAQFFLFHSGFEIPAYLTIVISSIRCDAPANLSMINRI